MQNSNKKKLPMFSVKKSEGSITKQVIVRKPFCVQMDDDANNNVNECHNII